MLMVCDFEPSADEITVDVAVVVPVILVKITSVYDDDAGNVKTTTGGR